MSEELKKNQLKGRNDAKAQRKPRQGRQGSHDKKHEKRTEEPKAPQKPKYEDPGPEFYKNLKRETDEILKITEEANSKYKKKEIQSNWAKYEIPIESYDEIEEQENMGADYEKLIEAPLSVGGHFQFKHEKSWDTDTGPSVYDKYFEINMDNLYLSISTVPFYERINTDKHMFSETDILSMNNRSTRFKQKYYNDKTFTTPELKAQDKIFNSLTENLDKADHKKTNEDKINHNEVPELNKQTFCNETQNKLNQDLEIHDLETEIISIVETKVNDNTELGSEALTLIIPPTKKGIDIGNSPKNDNNWNSVDQIKKQNIEIPVLKDNHEENQPDQDPQQNPIIESSEDLEKWLNDIFDD